MGDKRVGKYKEAKEINLKGLNNIVLGSRVGMQFLTQVTRKICIRFECMQRLL